MKYLKKLATMALIAGMLFSLPVGAATTTPATTSNQPQNANQAQNNPEFQKSLTDSAAVAQIGCELIDNGQYGQSWIMARLFSNKQSVKMNGYIPEKY